MAFSIELVEQMPEPTRLNVYTELYRAVDDLPTGKVMRIGPATAKEAASIQSSVMTHCRNKPWKMVSRICNKDGERALGDEPRYVFFNKLQKLD